MLWKDDGKTRGDGYIQLPENLGENDVFTLDQSRVLLLPPGQPPQILDLKRDAPAVSLSGIGSSSNVLGCFATNILCHWNGSNQIVVGELRQTEFIPRAAIAANQRPTGFAYHPARQLVAWAEGASSMSIRLASLPASGHPVELKSDLPGMIPLCFSQDGYRLAAVTTDRVALRVWNIETAQIIVTAGESVFDVAFALGGKILAVVMGQGNDDHEIRLYDLTVPGRSPRRFPGRHGSDVLAVTPDGKLVASSTSGGQVRLFDPTRGELIEPIHGHQRAAFGIAFSPDGRRLVSAEGKPEAFKLWEVATRQELLTLSGIGSMLLKARWSAGGDVILVGTPWQAWCAPSWEEIAAVESGAANGAAP